MVLISFQKFCRKFHSFHRQFCYILIFNRIYIFIEMKTFVIKFDQLWVICKNHSQHVSLYGLLMCYFLKYFSMQDITLTKSIFNSQWTIWELMHLLLYIYRGIMHKLLNHFKYRFWDKIIGYDSICLKSWIRCLIPFSTIL